MKNRVYVCHTYYHVYVTCLKELNLPEEKRGGATLLLSKLSNDFKNLKERAEASGLFEEVLEFDEKPEDFFPELLELKKDRGNIALNMFQRRKFLKTFAKLQEPYVPVNFRDYKDIYVYCDSDPIGYYLAGHKIYYHALEDGLNCIVIADMARYDNRGHFKIKAFLALHGFIFIQNGYSKYCLDMEVNDVKSLPFPGPKYIEKKREELVEGLKDQDKVTLTKLFIENYGELMERIAEARKDGRPMILALSEPLLPDLDDRKKLFEDMVKENSIINGKEGVVVIKPHPRDKLDYKKAFPEDIVLDAFFPMEILNFLPDVEFDRAVTVYTALDALHCVKDKVYLGNDFMDRYEDPAIHRENEASAAAG